MLGEWPTVNVMRRQDSSLDRQLGMVPQDIATTILDGFDKHFTIFRRITCLARDLFVKARWRAGRDTVRERIDLYDLRVEETIEELRQRFGINDVDEPLWQEVKLRYMGLLYEYKQPELAESFYNSVFCRLFDRRYYNNDNIFVRPAVSTEYIEGEVPVYRSYYPLKDGLAECLEDILTTCNIGLPFEDLYRDIRRVMDRWQQELPPPAQLRQHFQLHILAPLFYRNKAAYIVGRALNGAQRIPVIFPLLNNERGQVYVDTMLTRSDDVASLFSFARAYFMVDTDVPSALVDFLRTIQPAKSTADLYTAIGFHKHGKTQFYRDFLHHLQHSSDCLVFAPGTKGMVMLVFTLLSYPYVFKVIRDQFKPPKDTTRARVEAKYRMVKEHDRVGRMADTWEYSYAAFPLERFTEDLLAELKRDAASSLSIEGEQVVIKHVYIERRLMPLDLYLQRATDADVRHLIREYGDAVREMAAADVFPGDLLFKNFGATAHGRVIFYDYDEITTMRACRFRRIPPPRYPEDELSAEPWFNVDDDDVFPEEFEHYILGDARVRKVFLQYHGELLQPEWWQGVQEVIRAGGFPDVFPYPQERRFERR